MGADLRIITFCCDLDTNKAEWSQNPTAFSVVLRYGLRNAIYVSEHTAAARFQLGLLVGCMAPEKTAFSKDAIIISSHSSSNKRCLLFTESRPWDGVILKSRSGSPLFPPRFLSVALRCVAASMQRSEPDAATVNAQSRRANVDGACSPLICFFIFPGDCRSCLLFLFPLAPSSLSLF